MLPSHVARDILTSLKQFLVAAFDPAGIMNPGRVI